MFGKVHSTDGFHNATLHSFLLFPDIEPHGTHKYKKKVIATWLFQLNFSLRQSECNKCETSFLAKHSGCSFS